MSINWCCPSYKPSSKKIMRYTNPKWNFSKNRIFNYKSSAIHSYNHHRVVVKFCPQYLASNWKTLFSSKRLHEPSMKSRVCKLSSEKWNKNGISSSKKYTLSLYSTSYSAMKSVVWRAKEAGCRTSSMPSLNISRGYLLCTPKSAAISIILPIFPRALVFEWSTQ